MNDIDFAVSEFCKLTPQQMINSFDRIPDPMTSLKIVSGVLECDDLFKLAKSIAFLANGCTIYVENGVIEWGIDAHDVPVSGIFHLIKGTYKKAFLTVKVYDDNNVTNYGFNLGYLINCGIPKCIVG